MRKKKLRKCKDDKHSLVFWSYVGNRNTDLPSNHVDYNPKMAIFKCCNCDHKELRDVRIRHSRSPLVGKEQSNGIFHYFNKQQS